MGKLQGVKLTKELRSILDTVLDLPQPEEDKDLQSKSNDDKSGPSAAVASAGMGVRWQVPDANGFIKLSSDDDGPTSIMSEANTQLCLTAQSNTIADVS